MKGQHLCIYTRFDHTKTTTPAFPPDLTVATIFVFSLALTVRKATIFVFSLALTVRKATIFAFSLALTVPKAMTFVFSLDLK